MVRIKITFPNENTMYLGRGDQFLNYGFYSERSSAIKFDYGRALIALNLVISEFNRRYQDGNFEIAFKSINLEIGEPKETQMSDEEIRMIDEIARLQMELNRKTELYLKFKQGPKY